jgi:hypothetical protein
VRNARARWLSGALAGTLAITVLAFSRPENVASAPFKYLSGGTSASRTRASAEAYGKSGEVRVRLAMPSMDVEYPLEVNGDPSAFTYQWIRLSDSALVGESRPLGGSTVIAPSLPGFYQLAVGPDSARTAVEGLTVAVMVPFHRKLGTTLNGYRIGTYLGEHFGQASERPAGFLEVYPEDVNLALTRHLRVGDFLNHDDQRGWPRYVAITTNLLDKLELVATEVAVLQGFGELNLDVNIHSGFRTPEHNSGVKRAARDSRHQYGDAADVVIDANRDGRFTLYDSRMVALAVEVVERNHPELSGGLGLYTSRRYTTPYVHIDARGRRARWRG